MKINQLLEGAKQELIKNNIEDASMVARILLQYVFNMTRTELLRKDTRSRRRTKKAVSKTTSTNHRRKTITVYYKATRILWFAFLCR